MLSVVQASFVTLVAQTLHPKLVFGHVLRQGGGSCRKQVWGFGLLTVKRNYAPGPVEVTSANS